MITKLYIDNSNTVKDIMQVLQYYNINFKSVDVPTETGNIETICIIIDNIKSIKENDNYIILNADDIMVYITRKDIKMLYIETK